MKDLFLGLIIGLFFVCIITAQPWFILVLALAIAVWAVLEFRHEENRSQGSSD